MRLMRATAIVMVAGLALGVAGGCKHAASDYCDSDNPACPAGMFCDPDQRLCIELVDGAVISCNDSLPCTTDPDLPACVNMVCVQCDPMAPGDACADNQFPGCAADGSCTIACTADTDCSSDVCMPDGSCPPADTVIYTMPGGSMAPSTCTSGDPCDLEYAMTQISATRNIVRLTNAQYDTGATLTPGFDSYFVGRGATIRYSGGTGSVFHVTDGHRVEIDYITIRDGVGATGVDGNGVYCDNGATLVSTGMRSFSNDNHGISTAACTLDLKGVEVDGNTDVGITLNDDNASLTLEGSDIHNNVESGIHVILGHATIRRTVIRTNFAGGIELSDDQASTVENCIIAHNGGGGSTLGGIRFGVAAGHVFRFNTVSANLDSNPGSFRTGMQCASEVDGVANIIDDDVQDATCINDNSVFTENAGFKSGANQVTTTQAALFANTDMPGLSNYYRLLTGCPAVDHGGTGGPVQDVTVDIDGQPRPSGNASDSGADEVQQ